MSITEVIKRLEELKEKHGNIDVLVDGEYGREPASEIVFSEWCCWDEGHEWHDGVLIQ